MIIAGQYSQRQHTPYTPFQVDHNFLADRLQRQEQMYATADDMMSKYPNYLEGDKADRDKLVNDLKNMQQGVVDKYESGDMLAGNKKLYSAMRDVSTQWKEGGKAYHLQANYTAAQDWQKEQRQRLEKGEINQFQYYASVKDSLENFKTFGDDGQINSFSGRSRMNYVDADKFMMERLKLFQEQYTEEYGPPTREGGYMVWRKVGKKEIREEDIIKGLRDSWLAKARETGQLQDEYRYKKDAGTITTTPEEVLTPFQKRMSSSQEGLAVVDAVVGKSPEDQYLALSQVVGLTDHNLNVDKDMFIANENYREQIMTGVRNLLDTDYKSSSTDYEVGRKLVDEGLGDAMVYNLWEKDLAETYAEPYALMGRKLELKIEQDIREDIYEKFRLQSALQSERYSQSMKLAEYKAGLERGNKLWLRQVERANVLERPRAYGPATVGNLKALNPIPGIGELRYDESTNGIKFPGSGFMWRNTDEKTYDRAEEVFKMWYNNVASDELRSQVKGFDHNGKLVNQGPSLDGSLYHQRGAVAREFTQFFNNNYLKAQQSSPLEGDMPAQTFEEQREMGSYAFGAASQGADIFEIDPKTNTPVKIEYKDFIARVNDANPDDSKLFGGLDKAPLMYHFRTSPYNTVGLPSGMYVTLPKTAGRWPGYGKGERRFIIGDPDKSRSEMYKPLQEMFTNVRRNPEKPGITRDPNGNIYVYRSQLANNGEIQTVAQMWRQTGADMYSPLIKDSEGNMTVDNSYSTNLALSEKELLRMFENPGNRVTFSQDELIASFDQAYKTQNPSDATSLNLERAVQKEKRLISDRYTRDNIGQYGLDDLDYFDE